MSTFLAIIGYALLIGAGISVLAAAGVLFGSFLQKSTIDDAHH
ncbi:hypothetical protein BH24DEI1_BH24DEI1_16710 [soil metagenome]|jgi:hypothetical protein